MSSDADLKNVAGQIKRRLEIIPAAAKILKDDQLFESQTGGWGILIGRLKRLHVSIYSDRAWQNEFPSLWAGFESSTPKPFEDLLESTEDFDPVLRLEDSDSNWLSRDHWAYKSSVERPSNFASVLEEGEYFGVYYFGDDYETFTDSACSFLVRVIAKLLERESLEQQLGDLKGTERRAVILARRGQGKYRESLSRIEKGCRITGVQDPRFLRASHMKPWSLCDSSYERLDGNNGLLLTPTFDLMFDQGYLTFGDDGTPLLSPALSPQDPTPMGMPDLDALKRHPFSDEQKQYLHFHREYIFQSKSSN